MRTLWRTPRRLLQHPGRSKLKLMSVPTAAPTSNPAAALQTALRIPATPAAALPPRWVNGSPGRIGRAVSWAPLATDNHRDERDLGSRAQPASAVFDLAELKRRAGVVDEAGLNSGQCRPASV